MRETNWLCKNIFGTKSITEYMIMTRAMTLKDLNLDTSKYVIAHKNHY